jgi:hypothetical protein
MLRYKLRTLLILMAVGPPTLFVFWLLLQLWVTLNDMLEL